MRIIALTLLLGSLVTLAEPGAHAEDCQSPPAVPAGCMEMGNQLIGPYDDYCGTNKEYQKEKQKPRSVMKDELKRQLQEKRPFLEEIRIAAFNKACTGTQWPALPPID